MKVERVSTRLHHDQRDTRHPRRESRVASRLVGGFGRLALRKRFFNLFPPPFCQHQWHRSPVGTGGDQPPPCPTFLDPFATLAFYARSVTTCQNKTRTPIVAERGVTLKFRAAPGSVGSDSDPACDSPARSDRRRSRPSALSLRPGGRNDPRRTQSHLPLPPAARRDPLLEQTAGPE